MNMEVIINAGLPSLYFFTHPRKGIATLPQYVSARSFQMGRPNILLSEGSLIIEELAQFLGRTGSEKPGCCRRFFLGEQSYTVEDSRKALIELSSRQLPSVPFDIASELCIIAERLDDDLLRAIKVARVRGIWKVFAVTGNPDIRQAAIQIKECAGVEPIYLSRNPLRAAFTGLSRLRIVAGVSKTVVSTDTKLSRILKSHPDLTQSIDFRTATEAI
jgi:hypothetical protein